MIGGRVTERSSAPSASNDPRVWGLWEVGIACLRRRMVAASSAAAAGHNAHHTTTRTLSVLEAMVTTAAHSILSEYDRSPDAASVTCSSSTADRHDRPLLRNIVRTIVDLGGLP